jgi:hypothetical protein
MPFGYKAELSSLLLKRNLCPLGINADTAWSDTRKRGSPKERCQELMQPIVHPCKSVFIRGSTALFQVKTYVQDPLPAFLILFTVFQKASG